MLLAGEAGQVLDASHSVFYRNKRRDGVVMYNRKLKAAGDILDGATSALKGTDRRVSMYFRNVRSHFHYGGEKGDSQPQALMQTNSSLKSVAANSGYVKTVMFATPIGAAFVFFVSLSSNVDSLFGNAVTSLVTGRSSSMSLQVRVTIQFQIVVGLVAGLDGAASLRAGVYLAIQLTLGSGGLSFSISAGAGAGYAWRQPGVCIFSPLGIDGSLGGCKRSNSIGITIFSCSVNIGTGIVTCGNPDCWGMNRCHGGTCWEQHHCVDAHGGGHCCRHLHQESSSTGYWGNGPCRHIGCGFRHCCIQR